MQHYKGVAKTLPNSGSNCRFFGKPAALEIGYHDYIANICGLAVLGAVDRNKPCSRFARASAS